MLTVTLYQCCLTVQCFSGMRIQNKNQTYSVFSHFRRFCPLQYFPCCTMYLAEAVRLGAWIVEGKGFLSLFDLPIDANNIHYHHYLGQYSKPAVEGVGCYWWRKDLVLLSSGWLVCICPLAVNGCVIYSSEETFCGQTLLNDVWVSTVFVVTVERFSSRLLWEGRKEGS